MANPFLVGSSHEEIETAIIYEKAFIHDIGNAVAYTDGSRLFVNTEDNLARILPDYNQGFLKWILWHEQYHINLKHHNRFYKYLKELAHFKELEDAAGRKELFAKKFNLTKDEVNIIMDILVHDSLSKMFPELVETAVNNLAQMRNRNSLGYTFKTFNLEDMLDEYAKYKHGETGDGEGEGTGESEEKTGDGEGEGTGDKKSKDESKKDKGDDKKKDKADSDGDTKDDSKAKGHSEGGKSAPTTEDRKSKAEDGVPEEKDGVERPDSEETPSEHDKTDWSKLDKIDSKEFIEKDEADRYENEINRLKRKKLKMGRLTKQLNGLATTKRDRTYRLPSMLQMGDGCIFKGKTAGRVELYLVFDASGSMSGDMNTFKEIITKSIPQALKCPCEWFAGYDYDHKCKVKPYKMEHGDGYYKGKFSDFLSIYASSGYDDDGDRTIELCWQAEQKGYSPIGVTDGGGSLSWSKDKLKQLKRTVLVGQNGYWLNRCKEINPNIQILDMDI